MSVISAFVRRFRFMGLARHIRRAVDCAAHGATTPNGAAGHSRPPSCSTEPRYRAGQNPRAARGTLAQAVLAPDLEQQLADRARAEAMQVPDEVPKARLRN